MSKNNIETLLETSSALIASKISAHQISVQRWKKQGIPWKYWDFLIKTFKITLEELHEFNKSPKD